MRYNEVARIRFAHHRVKQVAEAIDIGIVQRCIDLVEYADRRRISEEQREDQRNRGQGLLAA